MHNTQPTKQNAPTTTTTLIPSKEEKLARLKILRCENVGPITFWNLIKKHKNAISALEEILKNKKYTFNEGKIKQEINTLKKLNGRFVFFEDDLYPPLLREIANPPPMLTMLGTIENAQKVINRPALSVVGNRNASLNAQNLCKNICSKLNGLGITIVSGLAKGIDSCAHKGSLENGTIAVLAGGANVIYPQENEKLYNCILENGIIFSEMPLDTKIQAGLFPQRNRIIAGISSGILVIEAQLQSGSLISAKYAIENSRNIYAVPGFPGDQKSQGCNQLIKQGAALVDSYEDILCDYTSKYDSEQTEFCMVKDVNVETSDVKKELLGLIGTNATKIDDLFTHTKIEPNKILAALLELELEDKITRLHVGKVCLKNSYSNR